MENYNNQKPYSGQNNPAYGDDTDSTVVLGAENGNSRYGSNPTYRDYVTSQQPPYGGQPPYGMQPQTSGKKGLTFGIVSLATCWLPILGVIFGIVGLVSSTNAKKAARASGIKDGKIVAGIICSSIGLGLSVIYTIGFIIGLFIGLTFLHSKNSYFYLPF